MKLKPENLIYLLETIAGTETSDIEGDEFDVVWEDEAGREGWTTESITEVAKQASDALTEQGKRIGAMADLLLESRDRMINQPRGFSGIVSRIDAALAGQCVGQHADDAAVDRFAVAMKAKLAEARSKGRCGWDDPNACALETLAALLLSHVGKGNKGTFEDIANFAMMLHQRGADPAMLAAAPAAPKLEGGDPCDIAPPSHQSLLDWAVTSWHEQVANRPMENVYRRTLDSVWRQVIRFAGEDPQSIIGPSHDDLLQEEPKLQGGAA